MSSLERRNELPGMKDSPRIPVNAILSERVDLARPAIGGPSAVHE